MNIYVLLPIVSMTINFTLGCYLLYKNWKHSLNRILALIFFAFVFWSWGEAGMRVVSTVEGARFWQNFSGFGWLFISSLFLHFMLIYSKKKKILRKGLTYLVLYTPSAVFFYLVWKTNLIIQEIGGFRWGYYDIPGKGFLFFVAYLQIPFFLGLYLCWQVYKKSSRMQEKKQAKCIFIGTLLSIIVGSVTDAILPIAGIPIIGLAASSNSILAMSIVYAIQKYKLMGITPQLAAEKIVNSMNDSLVAVDSDGTIAMVNKATEDLLGYKGEELIGRPIEILFEGDKNRLENLSKGETIKKFRMRYLAKDKKSIPISLSVSEIRDKFGDFIGKVVVAKDMREIENLIVELEKARNNLEKRVKEKTRQLEGSRNDLMLRLEELEKWRKITVDREEKMIRLKEEIEELQEKLK